VQAVGGYSRVEGSATGGVGVVGVGFFLKRFFCFFLGGARCFREC